MMLKKRGHPYAAAVLAVGRRAVRARVWAAIEGAGASQAAARQKVPPLPPFRRNRKPQQATPKGDTGAPLGDAERLVNMLPTARWQGSCVQAPDGQSSCASRARSSGRSTRPRTASCNRRAFRRVA